MEKPATPQHDLGPLRDAVLKEQTKLQKKHVQVGTNHASRIITEEKGLALEHGIAPTNFNPTHTDPKFVSLPEELEGVKLNTKPGAVTFHKPLTPHLHPFIGLSMAYAAGVATVLIALEIML